MAYQLKIDASPLYELVMTLSVYMKKNYSRYTDFGQSWVKEVQAQITPELHEEIMKAKDLGSWESYFSLLIMNHSRGYDVLGFLSWVEELSPGQLFELLALSVCHDMSPNIGEQKENYVSLLRNWYNQYFREIEGETMGVIKQETDSLKEELKNKTNLTIIEEKTNGLWINPNSHIETIILVPSIHINPLTFQFKYDSNRMYVIPYGIDLPVNQDRLPSRLKRIMKALSDETRMFILQFLSTGQKTFTDIHNKIGLSKATIFQHLLILRTSGLVRYRILEEKYEIKHDLFAEVKEMLDSFVYK